MGAELFFTSANGKTAKEAFNTATEDAQYESGHGGYTGTIAEKNDFIMCSSEVFASASDAYDFANKLIDDEDSRIDDKWGPAGCVSFKNKEKIGYLFFGWASS